MCFIIPHSQKYVTCINKNYRNSNCIEKAEKIDPKNIYAAQNIGFYYLKTGRSKKAINYLLNALKYPGLNDGKTEYFLSICYLQEDDKTNACKYLNISKSKNYPDAEQLVVKICK